jgi:hypothetical protein
MLAEIVGLLFILPLVLLFVVVAETLFSDFVVTAEF